jgi:hypothetical protein
MLLLVLEALDNYQQLVLTEITVQIQYFIHSPQMVVVVGVVLQAVQDQMVGLVVGVVNKRLLLAEAEYQDKEVLVGGDFLGLEIVRQVEVVAVLILLAQRQIHQLQEMAVWEQILV